MKEKSTIVRYTLEELKAMEISEESRKRLESITDDQIDYSDAPKLTKDQLRQFKPAHFTERFKKTEPLIDPEILDWFKTHSDDYRSERNKILKQHIENRSHSENSQKNAE